MALLNQLCGCLYGLCHTQASHDDGETTATECGDGDLALDFGEFGDAGSGGEDAYVVEFGQEEFFVF